MYEGVQDEIIIFRYSAIRNRGKFATTVRLSPFGDLDFLTVARTSLEFVGGQVVSCAAPSL